MMKFLVYFTWLSILITGSRGIPHTMHVGQLGMMEKCLLGKSVIEVGLDYIGYGCYCGFGSDGVPLDDTDRCCQVHDECYTAVQTSDMCRGYYHAYIIPYNYNAFQCGTSSAQIICSDASSYEEDYKYTDCAMAMCACDKAGAECFYRTRPTFNEDYIRYGQERC